MFRPTLLLLASALEGRAGPRADVDGGRRRTRAPRELVHDDSVDHSNVRRGQPTINAFFSHQIAVIMGDYLYSRALAELVRLEDLEPLRAFTAASNEMTLGEMRQLASYDALGFSERDYFALNRAKTASLLGAACEVGALCGAPRHRAALRRYGEQLGMAFQLADDLLDYTETESVTGKPSGLDLREHKVTLPLIAALPAMSPAQRAVVDALFAEPVPGRRADRGGRADRDGVRRTRVRAPQGRGVRARGGGGARRSCRPARRASRWRTRSPTSWTGGRNHGTQGIVQASAGVSCRGAAVRVPGRRPDDRRGPEMAAVRAPSRSS